MGNWGFKSSYKATSGWLNFEGNDYLVILISLHWLMDCWKILLFLRQLSVARKALSPPPELHGKISPAKFNAMRKSSMARSIASILVLFVMLMTKTLKLVVNYHPFLWELTSHYGETPLSRAVWYAAFDVLSNKLMFLAFAVFGMLMSVSSGFGVIVLFIATILEIFFTALLASVTMWVLALLTNSFGAVLLFNTPIISNTLGLVLMAYYIEFHVPESFEEVSSTNPELNQWLEPITTGVRFPADRIYVDSNPFSPPNAYFAGVFGANMIAVTPALIKMMGEHQVAAVIAHEIGHWVHNDNAVNLMFSITKVLCTGYGLSLAYGSSEITGAFRFQDQPHGMIPVYLWITYCSSWLRDLIDGIKSLVGCPSEYRADGFAVSWGLGYALKTSLTTLAAKSSAFPLYDRWFSAWFLDHPTIIDRIKRLE